MTENTKETSITIPRTRYNELMRIKTTYETEKIKLQKQIEELKQEACFLKNQIEILK